MAGSLSAKADRNWLDKNLNRAEKIYDGQKIYIPIKRETVKVVLGTNIVVNLKLLELIRLVWKN